MKLIVQIMSKYFYSLKLYRHSQCGLLPCQVTNTKESTETIKHVSIFSLSTPFLTCLYILYLNKMYIYFNRYGNAPNKSSNLIFIPNGHKCGKEKVLF